MILSTGKIAFPIEFDNGDIEYIYLNPNDNALIDRIMNFGDGIEKRIKQIDIDKYQEAYENGVNVKIDSIDDFENLSSEEMESLVAKSKVIRDIDAEYQQKVCEELDEVFDDNISEKIFKYVKPLQVVPKYDNPDEFEPYIIQFIRALSIEIEKYSKKTTKAMQKHIGKYQK